MEGSKAQGRVLISACSFLTTLMRPVVSYDDITLPYDSVSAVVQETSRIAAHNNNRTFTTNKSSSSKKRKRKSRHSAAATSGNHGNIGNNTSFDGEEDEDAVYLEVEESRELTHEEIWDDSALIEAWNAAAEEYKVKLTLYHERIAKEREFYRHITVQIKAGKTNPFTSPPCQLISCRFSC